MSLCQLSFGKLVVDSESDLLFVSNDLYRRNQVSYSHLRSLPNLANGDKNGRDTDKVII